MFTSSRLASPEYRERPRMMTSTPLDQTYSDETSFYTEREPETSKPCSVYSGEGDLHHSSYSERTYSLPEEKRYHQSNLF